jgi:hypothetical protein
MRGSPLYLIACVTGLATTPVQADTVKFDPGSVLVGEVKRLERGRLYFKTDATDTISIEWDDVGSLDSTQLLQIELADGTRLLGYLASASAGVARLTLEGRGHEAPMTDIVAMTPIETEFLERIDGEVNAGLNYTKDNDALQTNFGIDVEYVTDDYELTAEASSIISRDESNAESQRSNLTLRTLRRLHGDWSRWSVGGVVELERNDGLGTDLRRTLGFGGRRDLVQTNAQRLEVAAGLQFSQERVAGDSDDLEDSFEGLLSLDYEAYRYDSPELDLSSRLEIIPNFSDPGRMRANLDVTLKWELFEDLFWRISLYDSYDSDPPSNEADRNDYGVITGLAWEY